MDGGGQLVMDTQDIVAGTQVQCQNAKRSFLNEDNCKLSFLPNACSPGTTPKKVVVIDDATLVGINTMLGTKLYAVTNLSISSAHVDAEGNPYVGSPCSWSNSRWVRDLTDTVCANTASIGPETIKVFQDLIAGATTKNEDYNANVVHVQRSKRTCDPADETKLELGAILAGDGTCWKHVHADELSVYDFSSEDPAMYTLTSDATVSITDMEYFYAATATLPLVGKLGDHVELDGSEPSPLNNALVQNEYKTLEYNPSEGPVLVCGSPNEGMFLSLAAIESCRESCRSTL